MRRSRSEGRVRWRAGGPVLAGLLLAAGPPARLGAQVANNSGALFLVFPVGAQAVGMGQAGVALEGASEAAFWNPAALPRPGQNEFTPPSPPPPARPPPPRKLYFPSP